jgi:hypothetical protein
MVIEASDALFHVVVFVGIMIGSVGGATVIPYIRAKAKYQDFDVKILFDNTFLMTCAGSAVVAFVVVSGSFSTFLAQVVNGQPATYLAAFIAALGIGYTLNASINGLLPQPTNKEAAKELEDKKLARTMTLKGIDLERLQIMQEELDNNKGEEIDAIKKE